MLFVTGLAMALLKDSLLLGIFDGLFNPIFWPNSTVDNGSILYKSFSISLLGALMAMWGVLLFGIVRNAFKRGELWAWTAILYSTITWFSIDEFFSIYFKVWINAYGNILLFVFMVYPLIMTRKLMS